MDDNDRSVATPVFGLDSEVMAISAGGQHTCALTATGGVMCWGSNSSGQLGIGATDSEQFPTPVSGLNAGVTAISTGHHHACALTSAGGVLCWGENQYGQLGDGTTINRRVPTKVLGLSSGVVAIAAGGSHTCALTSAGGAKCWGGNTFGQLGNGTDDDSFVPTPVVGFDTGAAAIAAGDSHTCAISSLGGAMCWGDSYNEDADGFYPSRTPRPAMFFPEN